MLKLGWGLCALLALVDGVCAKTAEIKSLKAEKFSLGAIIRATENNTVEIDLVQPLNRFSKQNVGDETIRENGNWTKSSSMLKKMYFDKNAAGVFSQPNLVKGPIEHSNETQLQAKGLLPPRDDAKELEIYPLGGETELPEMRLRKRDTQLAGDNAWAGLLNANYKTRRRVLFDSQDMEAAAGTLCVVAFLAAFACMMRRMIFKSVSCLGPKRLNRIRAGSLLAQDIRCGRLHD